MPNPENQPNRREVLRGKLRVPGENEQSIHDQAWWQLNYGPLFQFSSNAMGCEFQVLCSEQARQPVALNISDGFALLHELENRFSIFRDGSEISILNEQTNQRTSDEEIAIAADLFQILKMAKHVAVASSGAFDITASPLAQLWKHCRKQRTLPDDQVVQETLKRVGDKGYQLVQESESIRILNNGLRFDLGAIGKGFAIDQLCSFLELNGCEDFLIHGGQSSAIGRGSRELLNLDPGNDDIQSSKGPWQIAISHPLVPEKRLATVLIGDQAIGTSGSGRKSFVHQQKRYGHIIDPNTGWPANHFISVTVLANSAMLADALSTAIFVAGPENAKQLCDQFDASAILINESTQESANVQTINIKPNQIRMEPVDS